MINKYTMILLAIIVMAGGIFGIQQIPKNSIPYKSIEISDCGMHYDVTVSQNIVYHVSANSVDYKNRRILVYKPIRLFLVVILYIILGIYTFVQIRVWVCKPDDFCTDFCYKWCEMCHRPPSEEVTRSIRTFFGLE